TTYVPRSFPVWKDKFSFFYCANEKVKNHLISNKVKEEKIQVVGQLVVEGVNPTMTKEETFRKWNLAPEKLTIGIFPGSRLYNMQDSLPVFLKIADEIAEEKPGAQFVVGVSPFLDFADIKETVTNPQSPLESTKGQIEADGDIYQIKTDAGTVLKLVFQMQYDIMNISDLVLTIPGTNTAECAYMGKPLIVISSWKARVPQGGLGVLIHQLPIGSFRRKLMMKALKKIKFTALPNLIADKKLVPEVIVESEASEVTRVALGLINNEQKRKELGKQLKEIMGEAGASSKISEHIINYLNEKEIRE
ncbi:MAG: hypothetical protein ACLFQV_13420, partial [Vulcanimicrobiota bacterium]